METFALVTEVEGDNGVKDPQIKSAGIESSSVCEAVVTTPQGCEHVRGHFLYRRCAQLRRPARPMLLPEFSDLGWGFEGSGEKEPLELPQFIETSSEVHVSDQFPGQLSSEAMARRKEGGVKGHEPKGGHYTPWGIWSRSVHPAEEY